MDNLTKFKIETLSQFLGIAEKEITKSDWDSCMFLADDAEYLVLNNIQANEKAKDEIKNSVWAFNADFICEMCDIPANSNVIKSLQNMQKKCCEDFNDFILALIKQTCGIEYFCKQAIDEDGRGHFLSGYDGEEHEVNGLYIYRVN
jgi:hypothetical protein